MSGKTEPLFSQRSPPTHAIGTILLCEAIGKVPTGNCRLIREETLNLPTTGERGKGCSNMVNTNELPKNFVTPTDNALIERVNGLIRDEYLHISWFPGLDFYPSFTLK